MNCPICQRALDPTTNKENGDTTYFCPIRLETVYAQSHYWINYSSTNELISFQCSVRDMDFRVDYIHWLIRSDKGETGIGISIQPSNSCDDLVKTNYVMSIDPFNYQEIIAAADTLLIFS